MKGAYRFLMIVLLGMGFLKSSAQAGKSYEAAWKRIDALVQKRNLPQSALAEVKKIYTQAKKEGQQAQLIKALAYTISLQQENRENSEVWGIKEVEKELTGSKEPATAILKTFLADLYLQYFQRNRWQLYQRTNTINFNKEDIATWTTEDFHKKITALYADALKNEMTLQQTPLKNYDAIIIKGNARALRPTLYDLLAHHALDYFKSSERDIKRPAYAFEIKQPQAFAPPAVFANYHFETLDSLSLQHKALQLYQSLIHFHLKDAQLNALLDVDVARLQYVREYSVLENKDSLYVAALKAMVDEYGNNAATAQPRFLIAAYYQQLAAQYNALHDTAHRYELLKAKALLEDIVKDSTIKNEGWANSYNLLHDITQPAFSFEVEKVNIPGQPFLSLVKFKNVTGLYLRLLPAIAMKNLQAYDDGFWSRLANITPLKTWQQPLPATNDLQYHAVEIKIDALPVGNYVLLASADKDFNNTHTPLAAQTFYVSNISYVSQGNQYFVLQRKSGQPLANASVQVYSNNYDYKTNGNTRKLSGNYTTDKHGYIKLKETGNYFLNIQYNNDSLELPEATYTYNNTIAATVDSIKKVFLFTDRAIYRPGQVLYFKGIAVKKLGDSSVIAAGFATRIFLQNANNEVIDSVTQTTNEFGSLSGKFQLPQNVLNGNFRIYFTPDDAVDISVEAYKRPKYYIAFDTLNNDYKVNDSIAVTGYAKGFAGDNVGGATVVYRVVRQPVFLYPWLAKIIPFPRAQSVEIAHGETVTNNKGAFFINFRALPDIMIDKSTEPLFNYFIFTDVTDMAGETHSSETMVSAGYRSLYLAVSLPQKIDKDSLQQITIRTENVNHVFQPGLVTVRVYTLIPEQRLIKKRYWQQPDLFVMAKDEFLRYFPNDAYQNEDDFKNWQRGEMVYNITIYTLPDGKWNMPAKQLTAGFYAFEITTKDKEGNEIKDVRFTEIFDEQEKKFISPEYLWVNQKVGIVQPYQTAPVIIGSAAKDVFLVQQKTSSRPNEKNDGISFAMLNNEKKTFNYSISENDRGGFGIQYFFVKENRFYQYAAIVQVPWLNKDLNINLTSFRDKTLPGSNEKWTVHINGVNKTKPAELLVSMYDASLDQFRVHQWQKPAVWPTFSNVHAWNGAINFNAVASNNKWIDNYDFKNFVKEYDVLNFNLQPQRVYKIMAAASVQRKNAVSDTTVFAYDVQRKNANLDAADLAQQALNTQLPNTNISALPIRKNFNETAFFLPHLKTDNEGNVSFSFTVPDALTTWKLQTLSHTKDLSFGLLQQQIIVQKQLMVQTNVPRFVHEGDRMEVAAKIINLSGKEFTGQAQLQLIDAVTNESVDGWFQNVFPNQYFTVAAGQSDVVKFPIEVPYLFTHALKWRVVAKADNFNDAEENVMPVLTKKIQVTETMPMPMRGSGSKNFTFNTLLNSNSETIQNNNLTVEFTANPAWYAVQALPFLTAQKNENAEQAWNRYYANALATNIANSTPALQKMINNWKLNDTAMLLSPLQQNEDLKSVLLQETPWVLEAKTEAEQKQNIAILFNAQRTAEALKSSMDILKSFQSSNGGFVWLKDGPDDRYITQYIISGIGHLKKLGAVNTQNSKEVNDIVQVALPYLDKKIKEDYDKLLKQKVNLNAQHIGYVHIQYLYMRSFFPDVKMEKETLAAYNFYYRQTQQYWMKQNKQMQGMIALALYRKGDKNTAANILQSLKQTAVINEETGMYWKDNSFGYSTRWWQAPIETQALLTETFSEISNDTKVVDDLKTWLIKNKQTNNWATTKATADACYAMLLQGANWLASTPQVQINVGTTVLTNKAQNAEPGTGYFKKVIEGNFVKPEMGNIKVTVQQPNNLLQTPSWGAAYWQYFTDADNVKNAATPLSINKKLFVAHNSDRGVVLQPVNDGEILKVGDKVKVRIELRVDRDMEYVQMKDMRAAAFEPVNIISGYKWQGGLGYYQTTNDATSNFFFSLLPKGTYVFEYELFVTQAGNFSNGITTLQSMYAPEFAAHSNGLRINVE